jgi:hypothetical protein
LVHCRNGPKWTAIGFAQDALVGVKHNLTSFRAARLRSLVPGGRTGCPGSRRSVPRPSKRRGRLQRGESDDGAFVCGGYAPERVVTNRARTTWAARCPRCPPAPRSRLARTPCSPSTPRRPLRAAGSPVAHQRDAAADLAARVNGPRRPGQLGTPDAQHSRSPSQPRPARAPNSATTLVAVWTVSREVRPPARGPRRSANRLEMIEKVDRGGHRPPGSPAITLGSSGRRNTFVAESRWNSRFGPDGQGRRRLTRERKAYLVLVRHGVSGREACKIVGVNVRTGNAGARGNPTGRDVGAYAGPVSQRGRAHRHRRPPASGCRDATDRCGTGPWSVDDQPGVAAQRPSGQRGVPAALGSAAGPGSSAATEDPGTRRRP